MKIQQRLYGVNPALITPLTGSGDVDSGALRNIIRRALEAGCNGVMLLGSAGSGTIVSKKNYFATIETAVSEIGGKSPIIVGAGGQSMPIIRENIQTIYETGADAALVVPPFYYDIDQQKLSEYFISIANNSKVPVMIYNIPQFVTTKMSFETVLRLSKEENIVGMKDSSGDFAFFQKVIFHAQNDNFKVFQGRAPYFLGSLLIGAAGTQGPIPNFAPWLEIDLLNAVKQNDLKKAIAIQALIFEIVKIFAYKSGSLTTNVNGLMASLGLCEKYTVDPLPELDDDSIADVRKMYDKVMENY